MILKLVALLLPIILKSAAMSGSAEKPQRPPFIIEVASTEEKVQACFDVRVESESDP